MTLTERLGFTPVARGSETPTPPDQVLSAETRLAGGMTLAEVNRKLAALHEAYFRTATENPQPQVKPVSGLET